MGKLKKEVRDLDGLRFMMNMLKEVRQRESGINMEINPIMNMYQVRMHDHAGGCVDPPPFPEPAAWLGRTRLNP